MSDASGTLHTRYELIHGGDTEALRGELARLKAGGKTVVIVSACLAGVRCRFDGRDKRDDAALARAAGGDVEILPLCPEVLAQFGVPRPPITLGSDGKSATDDRGRDVSSELEAGARLADLIAREAGAARALLKERSPSCGVTEVHGPDGVVAGQGRFAARLAKRGLPIVSERAT
jgi:uncharacterized protein YbbK (DUF523 family)